VSPLEELRGDDCCSVVGVVTQNYAVVGVPSKDLRGDDLHQQPELMTAQWPDVFI